MLGVTDLLLIAAMFAAALLLNGGLVLLARVQAVRRRRRADLTRPPERAPQEAGAVARAASSRPAP